MKRITCLVSLMLAWCVLAQAQINQYWNATPNDVNNLLKSMKDMIGVNYNMQVRPLSEISEDPGKNPILFRSGHYNYS